jgi:hypothetical protein
MYGIALASYLPVLTLAELQKHQTRSAFSRNLLSARRHNNEAVDNTDTTDEKKACDGRTSQHSHFSETLPTP